MSFPFFWGVDSMQGNPFARSAVIPPVPKGWPLPVMANGSFNAGNMGPVDHSVGLFAVALSFSHPSAPSGPEAGEAGEPAASVPGGRPNAC